METRGRKRGESKLTDRQREVIQHRLDGKTNGEIAKLLVISEGTVKSHVSQGLTNLGFDSKDYEGDREFAEIKDQVSTKIAALEDSSKAANTEPPATETPVTETPVTEPPVNETPVTEPPVTEPPATEPPVTEPPTTEPPDSSTEPINPTQPTTTKPTDQPSTTPPTGTITSHEGDIVVLNPVQRPRWPWLVAGIGLGVVWLLAAQLYAIETNVHGGVSGLFTGRSIMPPSLSTQVAYITQTVMVTQPVFQTVVVPQTVIVSQIQVVTVTQLIPVTAAPGQVIPTIPATQPAVTATSVATGPGIPLPFSDNFTRLRSEWVLLRGERSLAGGKMTAATPDVALQLGNDQLQTYTVAFNIDSGQWQTFVVNFGPEFRYVHTAAYVGFLVCSWQHFENGGWVDKAPAVCPEISFRLKMQVDGNTYSVGVNGDQPVPYTYELTTIHGPFGISFPKGTYISNFTLTVP